MATKHTTADGIVVGLGAMGSAVTLQLAQRGLHSRARPRSPAARS